MEIAERLAKRKRRASGDRWARFNAFVDLTMNKLTPAQTAVWTYMYRNEREGVVRESVRQIAAGTGLTRKGAHEAMQKMVKAGLIEVVKRSRSHAESSVYRLHHDRPPST